jgi:hypothetical protein
MATMTFSMPGFSSQFLDYRPAEQNSLQEPRVTEELIEILPDNTHQLLSPIRVHYERLELGYIASFTQANIAISGITKSDAREALIDEILDAYDDWTEDESSLGIGPRQQLTILKNHIRC